MAHNYINVSQGYKNDLNIKQHVLNIHWREKNDKNGEINLTRNIIIHITLGVGQWKCERESLEYKCKYSKVRMGA